MMRDYRKFDRMTGKNEVVFIITYREHQKDAISNALHRFDDAIRFTIHQHHASLGLDIINVEADAKRIRELFSLLKRSNIRSLDFALLGPS
jgi:metal-responsive CopG/Arc/MetJ family transcriptional regulator